MALRENNSTKLGQQMKPDAMKSDSERAKDNAQSALDTAASYLPGQSKPRDALNSDARDPNLTHDDGRQGGLSAFKPAGQQTKGEFAQNNLDQGASNLQGDKSNTQAFRDAVTPGNATHPVGEDKGVLSKAADKLKEVKDAVTGQNHA